MDEQTCVNCGTWPDNNPDEVNQCMLCGSTLCERCYDESPYCHVCEQPVVTHGGECRECGRSVTALSSGGLCEGCTMEAMIGGFDG